MPLCNIWRCPAPAVPDIDNRLELETLRRRAQTESARASALLSRQAKRLAPNQESVDDGSALEHFQASWFTEQFQTTINDKFSYRPRARAVMSYLRALVSKMSQTFRSTEVNVNHMISINIVDDTNLKLKDAQTAQTQGQNNSLRQQTRKVFTCMNNIQSCLLALTGDNQRYVFFNLHQPSVFLPFSKARSQHSENPQYTMSQQNDSLFMLCVYVLVNRLISVIP